LASGILFAAGHVATKMAVSGGTLERCFPRLPDRLLRRRNGRPQAAFQRGSALTTAGLSALLTNALPIAAGMVLFHEPLPSGLTGAARVVAFATVVVGAVLLAARSKEGRTASVRASSPQADRQLSLE
jgi:hypothetical protein